MPTTLSTRDGREWTPSYLDSIDYDACIGCGRCFKVCGRSVMAPIERPLNDDDDGDDEDECITTVMSVADAGNCIGCQACAKVCAKKAHTHVAAN
jgi:Nif-specific ferredoxin III